MEKLKNYFKIEVRGYCLAYKMDYDSHKIFFSLDEVMDELTKIANSVKSNQEIPLSFDEETCKSETKPINIEEFQEKYIPNMLYVDGYSFLTASDGSTHQRKDKYTIVSKGSNQYNLILED